ncbi:MAG TPA: type II toxin-antitoxin system prevent-host-death family antitoxin [Vicinamibacterales bacterium]|nr:type II toxin-antitoxin system prevent-host-death family antitoxin [Vicinamibacterales bacterium]
MTGTANVAQIKARLSEYLRQVKDGSEVVITERGIPVARLVPLAPDEKRATREERLIRLGALRPPAAPRRQLGAPTLKRGAGRAVLQALLAERDESR